MLRVKETQATAQLKATIAGLVVVAAAVVGIDQLKSDRATATNVSVPLRTPAGAAEATNAVTPTSTSPAVGAYKDGTYSATGTYYVPRGSETIQVTATITSGVISNSAVQNSMNDRESARYQQDFASEYKSFVVGKPIRGLQLDSVAGASDTTAGFNDALQKIAAQAQA